MAIFSYLLKIKYYDLILRKKWKKLNQTYTYSPKIIYQKVNIFKKAS